jgi:exodeoxyribonuclease V alpha subunit
VEQKLEDLIDLQLGYAITVHKSQGSQFLRVIVPIARNRMLDRTLIYTALTRAVFVGNWAAFCHAISKEPNAVRRQHALKLEDNTLSGTLRQETIVIETSTISNFL